MLIDRGADVVGKSDPSGMAITARGDSCRTPGFTVPQFPSHPARGS
jgi:hypothetical protein